MAPSQTSARHRAIQRIVGIGRVFDVFDFISGSGANNNCLANDAGAFVETHTGLKLCITHADHPQSQSQCGFLGAFALSTTVAISNPIGRRLSCQAIGISGFKLPSLAFVLSRPDFLTKLILKAVACSKLKAGGKQRTHPSSFLLPISRTVFAQFVVITPLDGGAGKAEAFAEIPAITWRLTKGDENDYRS